MVAAVSLEPLLPLLKPSIAGIPVPAAADANNSGGPARQVNAEVTPTRAESKRQGLASATNELTRVLGKMEKIEIIDIEVTIEPGSEKSKGSEVVVGHSS
ncbi:hypothetical protein THARTR1_10556 [Trichoderma harzianum]|uniref:Uncharacterized protein n=1 Tax=Trichoderma harzianum TaxID=5544 RepID=A0A2K0TNE2_TRIHA|nr:hypothetical protein THARTR1_10556 [Trichoderma harzianum]